VKGKYFKPITSTAPKITTTTDIDLTLTWSSKKSYIIMLLPVKSINIIGLELIDYRIIVPSKESIAFSAQLECILDALSPPKRFGLTEILHGTSALGDDRFNNRFSKRRELSQSNITNYSKLPVLFVTHF
jgi:hypothetical protein